jgi:hypothetical protein
MRTKALLLAAAFAAAGVATSMAQVYSVNAVGYVNVSIPNGFSMGSNPLNAADNSVTALFKNTTPALPGGFKVFVFKNGGFLPAAQWDDLDSVFIPAATAAELITPGNGVFVFNPGSTALTLTFVGEVSQGTLSNPLPKGFSIKANMVPQAGAPDSFGLPAQGGDKVFVYDTTAKGYKSWQFDDLDNVWLSSSGNGLPSIAVGQAFFLFRAVSAGSWNRTFNVNNPT